jgi:hypothetical protein
MALDSKNFIKKVFINKNLLAVLAGVVARPDTIAEGQVVITNLNNVVINSTTSALAATRKIKVIQGRGIDKPLLQFELDIDKLVGYSGGAFQCSKEQITYFGYNGSTGVFDVAPAATAPYTYLYKLTPQNNTMMDGLRPTNIVNIMAEVGAGATQATIANTSYGQFLEKFKFHKAIDWRLLIERVNSGTRTALGTGVNDVVFTKGSKTISATDIDDAAGSTALAAGVSIVIPTGASQTVTLTGSGSTTGNITVNGLTKLATFNTTLTQTATDFVTDHAAAYAAFGITVTSSGTVLTFTSTCEKPLTVSFANVTGNMAGSILRVARNTDPVYTITAIDIVGNTATLDFPYQGATETIDDTNLRQITVANLGNYGIKLTGIRQKYDVVHWRQYDKVRFAAAVVQGGVTPVTYAQIATEGNGVYEKVANDEYISWGDEGQYNPMQLPPLTREQDAVRNTPYSLIVLNWLSEIKGPIAGFGSLPGQVLIYLDKSVGEFPAANNVTAVTGVKTVLDAWAAKAGFAAATI